MTKLDAARVEAGIEESGMKLYVIADKLGMTTRNLYYRRKTGRWSVDQLCQLADMLYTPIASFFTSELP